MEKAEDTCRSFVQMWAEAVVLQDEHVRRIRRKADADGRAYERMEDWSPTELDLARNVRSQWAEEHTLVWAAHQVERWARRLAKERGEEPPPRDQVLADLRNALEHLDEAQYNGGHAVPVPGDGSRSLRALPNSRLAIETGHRLAFGEGRLVGGYEQRALTALAWNRVPPHPQVLADGGRRGGLLVGLAEHARHGGR